MNFADTYYKKTIIQNMFGQDDLVTVFCSATNMPLVECSKETCNDRIYVLDHEKRLKDFMQPYLDQKLPVRGVKFAPKDKVQFFAIAASINVDEIVYVDSSGRHILQLSDVVKKKDLSDVPKEKRPLENPALQLSALYFIQEASRGVPPSEKPGLKELEEEMTANLLRGTYLIPADLNGEEPKGEIPIKIPLVKMQNGDMFQPIFCDTVEFGKYNKDNKFKALAVPFASLEKLLAKEAKGFMLNPNGFHLIIPRELLQKLMEQI